MSWTQFFMILATIHIARVLPLKNNLWLAYAFMLMAVLSYVWTMFLHERVAA